ncbi:SGNH/GDSL hydrolase family protein [Tateyamaria sp. SN3-11]|uniref:SGNH/GDSL hydrolase family protein n=1 Tax=Tateyamaria sp. SN3-11 TaxID=3092147 RepID=UPI0039ECEA61
MRVWMVLLAAWFVVGCIETAPRDGKARILAMGDSMFAVHGATGRSMSHQLEARLKRSIVDRSVLGARFLYPLPVSGSLGLRIGSQYVERDWDWVILNGGGNDLWLACGCLRCDAKLDRLVSADGTEGAIVDVVNRARAGGARVLFVGYLRSPGVPSLIDHCAAYGDALEDRLIRMAERDSGVSYLSLKDLVPEGDRSFHAPDLIHPSYKGSAAIAARVAKVMAEDG